jgi:DNA-binding winged helix-turn-helix (wHTH) protein/TolB-like protein/tetratricopeptide (TPR) repeat protein
LITAAGTDIFELEDDFFALVATRMREEEQQNRVLALGDWRANPSRDVLSHNGEDVKIEPKAMEVLMFLARHPGLVVPQREIEAAVWRDVVVTPQSLYQSVAQLRRVLGDDARQPRYIETVPRRGYRLVAPVEWIATESSARPVTASPLVEPFPDETPAPPTAGRRWLTEYRWRSAVAAILLSVAAAFAGATLLGRPAPAPAPKAIAVMTFETAGAAGEDDGYLAEAITEELVNALGQVEGLRVAARNSTQLAAVDSRDPQRIGARLRVTHLLEGSVRRVDGRVRVVATLVDTSTGYQEWSRTFERPAVNLLRLPTDIAGSTAGALRLVLVGDAGVGGSRVGTRNPTAYDFYMLGQQRAGERTAFSLDQAERYFQQAIEADALFAAAYAALAEVYVAEFNYANRPRAEAFDLATPLLERALELDPAFGPAYALKGLITLESGHYPQASEQLGEAVRLAPNDAKAHLWLGGALFADAQLERALAAFDRGLELDPLNFILHGRRAILLQSMGRRDEADRSADRASTLAPRHPNPRWVLGLLAKWRGDTREAIRHLESALSLDAARSDLRIELALLYLDGGNREQARAELVAAARQARGSALYLGAAAYEAIEAGNLRRLGGLAESLASIDSGNLFYLRDAASLMLLAEAAGPAVELFERAIAIDRPATLNDLRAICNGTMSAAPHLAAAYSRLGRRADGLRVVDEFEAFLGRAERLGLSCWGTHYQRALIAALRDRPVEVIAHLEQAHVAGWRRTWWARIDPAIGAMHDVAAFRLLLERIDGT